MRAIECDFPIEPLSRLAELESWRKEVARPTYYVHKWWARRLGSVFRAILLGTLLDDTADVWQHFYKPHQFTDRIILDPFMGGGTTLGEAVKLGCRVVGCDINPVAWYLVRSALQRVSPDALTAAFQRLEQTVAPRLRAYYRSSWAGQPAEILYAFWVKTIHCPDCQTITRLFSNWIFSANAYPQRKPEAQTICPSCGHIHAIHFQAPTAICPSCRHVYNPQAGPARRTTFICEGCGLEWAIAETYRRTAAPPEHQLYALMLLLPDGRKVYKRPDSDDLTLYAQAAADWETARLAGAPYPKQEIPPGNNTDQARGYNYRFWYQMCNARQLLCLSSLLEAIVHEPDRPIREQLLLLFSGILEFNNLFCSFKGEGTGAVRPLFSHHIIKPERTPLEANVWGTPKSSGSFSTLFERRLLAAQAYAADPFELKVMDDNGRAAGRKVYRINRSLAVRLADAFDEVATGAADALILSGDSASLPLPDGCVDAVVTDPPYFDNVHYSELADFFHVWLRLAFDGNDSAFSAASTRHPNEVQDTDPSAFEKGLGAVLAECRRVLKPDGMVTFTFQHARMEAWLALVNALEHARLRVVATHPIKAEMSVATPKSQAKEPINLDVVFVCRPVSQMADHTFVLPTVDDLLGRVREYVLRLTTAGLTLSRGDLFVIAMSQFVTQCQSANDLDGVYRRAFSDEQAAILAELGVALERLSPDELIARREARQLRLLDEPALYTVPETAGYAIS